MSSTTDLSSVLHAEIFVDVPARVENDHGTS